MNLFFFWFIFIQFGTCYGDNFLNLWKFADNLFFSILNRLVLLGEHIEDFIFFLSKFQL